jgi:CheY-like chemotaxis protein
MEEELLRAEKLESVGVLAGGIAHDFNNYLMAILGNIALAVRSIPDGSPAVPLLAECERACSRARDLTQQLLTFAKGGAPVRATLDLRPVIREATLFALSGSRVDCEFSVDEGLWAVEADERQVALVLHHLVLNAEQAMPGGGRVAVSARNVPSVPDAGPAAGAAGRVVEITVRDGGPGIPAENLPQIFDPYFTTKEKGSGLGLASVYAIVVNHGGTITAASSPGEGATFTVRLPASDRDPRAAAPGEAAQPGRAARILVMDDEEIVRQVAEAMLGEIGHQVTLAADGTAAVARYREALAAGRRFDAVILDLTVRGGVGGLEALQHLLEIDPGVRAAASSGYSDDAAAAEHRRHGFRAFLPKPYTMRGLEAALAELLGD